MDMPHFILLMITSLLVASLRLSGIVLLGTFSTSFGMHTLFSWVYPWLWNSWVTKDAYVQR